LTGESGALDRLCAAEVRRGATPGASWWVGDERGPIATGVTGNAALLPAPEPLRPGTPFDLASVTKPVATALLASMLAHEGKLSWDETLGTVFAELSGTRFAPASLRDCATHRAGFPAWAPLYASGATPSDYVRAIAAVSPHGAPGDTLYSDLGYLLLGFAVERAGEAPLDRLFDARIARPLGLRRCGFPGAGPAFADAAATEMRRDFERTLAGEGVRCDHVLTDVPRGQVHDGNAWGIGGIAGHAGLFGLASDVAAIGVAMLDPSRLGLLASDLDALLRPDAGGVATRTAGFMRAAEADSVRGVLPDDAVGHWGFTGTSLWIDVSRPRVYVLLTNRVHPGVPAKSFVETRRAFHTAAAGLP
jgi:CubicO group peptidase (beta-lactamase class C family)